METERDLNLCKTFKIGTHNRVVDGLEGLSDTIPAFSELNEVIVLQRAGGMTGDCCMARGART